MAALVLTNAFVSLGGTNISSHLTSVTLEITADAMESTSFGDAFRTRVGGLKDWTVTLEFNQDFAASQLDATLWPLLGTVVAVVIRPNASAAAATNPEYKGNAVVTSYPPLTNSVGDLATGSISLEGAGALTRAVS